MFCFPVITVPHARFAMSLISQLGGKNTRLYTANSVRKDLVERELAKYPESSKCSRKSISDFFLDMGTERNTFFSPLMLGPITHPFYKSVCKGWQDIINMPLGNFPGQLVMANESVYSPWPQEIPHSHIVLCRTKEEKQAFLAKELAAETKVFWVGDSTLDNITPLSHKKGLLIATAGDPIRRKAAKEILQKISEDLFILKGSGYKPSHVFIKGHPGDENSSYQHELVMTCKQLGWDYSLLDRCSPLEEIFPKCNTLISQSSLTSFLLGCRGGIDSFFYYSSEEKTTHSHFANATQMPDFTIANPLSSEEKLSWINQIFRLDGLSSQRIVDLIQ